MSVELRAPVPEDAAAIAAALNEFNRTAGFDLDSPEEVGVWLEFPSFDLERDTRPSPAALDALAEHAPAELANSGLHAGASLVQHTPRSTRGFRLCVRGVPGIDSEP